MSKHQKELSALDFKNPGKAWVSHSSDSSPSVRGRKVIIDPDADIAKAIEISLQESRIDGNNHTGQNARDDAKTPQQPSRPFSEGLVNSAQRTVVKNLCSSTGRFEDNEMQSGSGPKFDANTSAPCDDGDQNRVSVPVEALSPQTARARKAVARKQKEVVADSEEEQGSSGSEQQEPDDDYGAATAPATEFIFAACEHTPHRMGKQS